MPELEEDDNLSDRPKKQAFFVKKDTKQEDEERKKLDHEDNKRRAIVKLRKEVEKMPIRTLDNPDGISIRQALKQEQALLRLNEKAEASHP